MKQINLFLLIITGILLSNCSSGITEEIPQTGLPVGFSAFVEELSGETRADAVTDVTSMGVFAYATKTTDFNWTTSLPNFMYNQQMTKNATTGKWDYTPQMYWPLNTEEKITFYAYAPHNNVITNNGDELSLSASTVPGLPTFIYTNNTAKTDLLLSTPIQNRTNLDPNIRFTLKHALVKISFSVQNFVPDVPKTVTSITVKARNKCTITETQTNGISYDYDTSGGAATYSTGAGFSIPLTTGDETVYPAATFFLLPYMEDATYNVTYTVDDGSGQSVTTSDQSFPTAILWAPGASIVYILKIGATS